MKKLVAILLVVLCLLSLCASAEEYPSGWYSLRGDDGFELSLFYLPEGSSVTLPDSMTLSPLETVRPFTAAPGIYTVGVDFPAGAYSVRGTDGVSLLTIRVKDTEGRTVFNESFWTDKGEYLGKIELVDGYTVSVVDCAARFETAGGIVFDD